MAEQREQCCGNCRWWVKYRSWQGGWCYLDGVERVRSESCWEWEGDRMTGDKSRVNDPHGQTGGGRQ
jgi:hypothetical protein